MRSRRPLLPTIVLRALLGFVCIGACVFVPAGTLAHWPTWLYLVALFAPMTIATAVLARRDPELLERRMRTREKERAQGRIVGLAGLAILAVFVVAGLDARLQGSHVPTPLILAADVATLLGYRLLYAVLRANSYAARTVEVMEGQVVIDHGPYGRVRHPMYTAVLVMYLATPIALGSWFALVPALVIPPLLAARILGEEAILRRSLAGYAEYCERVRWRLVPGLW